MVNPACDVTEMRFARIVCYQQIIQSTLTVSKLKLAKIIPTLIFVLDTKSLDVESGRVLSDRLFQRLLIFFFLVKCVDGLDRCIELIDRNRETKMRVEAEDYYAKRSAEYFGNYLAELRKVFRS